MAVIKQLPSVPGHADSQLRPVPSLRLCQGAAPHTGKKPLQDQVLGLLQDHDLGPVVRTYQQAMLNVPVLLLLLLLLVRAQPVLHPHLVLHHHAGNNAWLGPQPGTSSGQGYAVA